ncbi:hypothetical protein C8A00DRAFT_36106 [Chaetomidium leptoderma]|uniref:Zn(2)-C6 fungal-type domain-containing protein n=1 Tax=Chaetomidium leptoderma TaxID=669021 RepID=A0AAN6VGR5_9PEZI|nr:hypothetical protein C8A00DRAFT_36106 [Chaetomidium leptoderma]
MASASVSSGTSPHSGFELEFPQHADSNGDPDEALWAAISSNPSSGSLGPFLSSPAGNSVGSSWAVLGNGQIVELAPSPVALPSPLNGNFDQLNPYLAAIEPGQSGVFTADSGLGEVSFFTQGLAHDGVDLSAPAGFVMDNGLDTTSDDLDPFNPFSSASILQEPFFEGVSFDNAPWEPVNLRCNDISNDISNDNSRSNSNPPSAGEPSPIFVIEDPSLDPHYLSRSPSHSYSPSLHSASVSPPAAAASPHSPTATQIKIKRETPVPERLKHSHSSSSSSTSSTAPRSIPTRKANTTSNRIQKRKPPPSAPHPSPTSSTSTSSSSSSSSASSNSSKFLIVTPSSIVQHNNAHPSSTNLNPFDCLDAFSRGPTQRGRKGPLATDTKQSALVVRRIGACFSCHARKVRCDKERPCRNCVRLAGSVPQVVCWQFGDFTPVLFPGFIRAHLRKEEVVRFVEGNVESFAVGGVEVPCRVELMSGVGFGRGVVLEVKAKFFTARTPDVLQHWHATVGRNGMDLFSRGAAPIGLEMTSPTTGEGGKDGGGGGGGGDGQKAELKRRVREYIQAIVDEPRYAELVTPAPQHTDLPRKVLAIVHDYANRCDVPMVRRALSIYAMHFVMTRHLCLTPQNIADLQSTGLVPQGVPWVTPRVLNRQIKAVIDEMLCREMQLLFENFSKSLKPKLRREWAPCLASFLVLCLFMESVEVAADMFVISDNEINLRHHYAPAWKRSFVLDINGQIENMPFKQFAFQFHQIYQTHSRDAAARSFNPLVDDACFELGELDREAADMVKKLRHFINDDWSELDYLTADPILPNIEDHPYPRNVAHNYTGRLVAKFLLSFTDEKYIFDPKA